MTAGLALATYVVLGLGLFGLFALGDRRLDASTRGAVTDWLARRSGAAAADDTSARAEVDWPAAFLAWFDRVFGVREVELPLVGKTHLPRLWRSIVASFLALLVLCVVWVLHKETLSRQLRFGDPFNVHFEQFSLLLLIYGGATLITNWIPDYLSLIQSRLVMQRIAATRSTLARLGWLALDFVLTASIAFLAIFLGMKLLLPFVENRLTVHIGCFSSELFGIDDAWKIFVAGIRFETPPGTLNYDASGIYIYSTFMTSLWVWIYLVVGFVVRAAAALRGASERRLIQRRPLLAMGLVAVVGFSAVFWSTWLVEGARRVDVALVATAPDDERDEGEASESTIREIAASMRADGLRVEIIEAPGETPPDERRIAALDERLGRAELVIVFSSPGDGSVLVERLVRAQIDEDERPRGTTRTEWMDPSGFLYTPPEELVRWAKRANSLLGMEQLEVCRERWPERFQPRYW